jgi:hypothetical protein
MYLSLLERYWYTNEEEEQQQQPEKEELEFQDFDPNEVGLQQEELDEMFIDMLVCNFQFVFTQKNG